MSNYVILFLYLFLPPLMYGAWKASRMMIANKKWREAKRLKLTEEDQALLNENFPPYLFLTSTEKESLNLKINYFLLHKRIEAVGALKLNKEMKLLIAAHACLIITNLELDDIYPGLKNIYVMEGSYIEKNNPVNPDTGLPAHLPRLGESWKRGPVILSWDSVEHMINYSPKKHNLIIHEFSHHLDQQDGHFDGTPKLQTSFQFHHWANVMGREYLKLRDKVARQQRSDIEAYGATNEAEFFAVCSEYFFTDPLGLIEKHPEIFQIYLDYFKIDPRKWNV